MTAPSDQDWAGKLPPGRGCPNGSTAHEVAREIAA